MLRVGDTGPAVRMWQASLAARGAKITVDGVFGPATHNATLAFQASQALPTTGVVDTQELDVVAELAGRSLPPPPTLAHSIPFVEARFYLRNVARVCWSGKPGQLTIDAIVLHSMEAPEASTTAERVALYFARLPPSTPKDQQKSTHYNCDSDSVVQGVPDHLIAYHARGCNQRSIGIEHAGYARQTREEWLDEFGRRMLGLSVQLSARLCERWAIPPVVVTAAELREGKRGITTHAEASAAFGKSDHTDPGPGFPLDWYVERVAALLVASKQANV